MDGGGASGFGVIKVIWPKNIMASMTNTRALIDDMLSFAPCRSCCVHIKSGERKGTGISQLSNLGNHGDEMANCVMELPCCNQCFCFI